MNNEYIEREKIWPALNAACVPYNRATARAIESIPAADVAPVRHGRWIDTDNYYMRWKCSECGNHTRDARPPYCPNCGALMDADESEPTIIEGEGVEE